jgi:hypothetical protein
MLNHSDESQRKSAADILGKSAHPELGAHLMMLYHDKSLSVRKAAVLAASQLKNPKLFRAVFDSENTSLIPQSIIEAIVDNPSCISLDALNVASLPPEALALLIKACAYLETTESMTFLLSHLDSPNTMNQYVAIMALMQRNYLASDPEIPHINKRIDLQIDQIKILKKNIATIPQNAETEALRNIFSRFLWILQHSLLALLSFIYGHKDMHEISLAFESSNDELHSYALELLDRILLQNRKAEILYSFEPLNSNPSGDEHLFEALLANSLSKEGHCYDSAIIVAMIYYIGANGKSELKDKLIPYLFDANDLLKETAHWAIKKLH